MRVEERRRKRKAYPQWWLQDVRQSVVVARADRVWQTTKNSRGVAVEVGDSEEKMLASV